MRRPIALAAALTVAAPLLPAQPNQPPVSTTALPALTARPNTATTRVYSLNNFFRDQDIGTALRFNTSVGAFSIALYDSRAPLTVANFLRYADRNPNGYTGTFFHRVPTPTFVVQGGTFITSTLIHNAQQFSALQVTADPAVQNEFGASNLRGTVAMARLGGQPNSATTSWFVNVVNNTSLDTVDGGFTVFGRIVGNGMATVDAINALPKFPNSEVPVRNYTSGFLTPANLVNIDAVTRIPTLAFGVSSSVPGVVDASVTDADLTLTFPGGTGTSSITVTATDLDGAPVTSSFDVAVSAAPPQANLANISTRAAVGTGENVLIGGFVVRGSAKRVLIRALGPSLIPLGLPNAITDPQISLQSGQTVIASNDNWKSSQQADIQATGFAPTNDSEAALIATLPPGSYTPIVSGVAGATGISIIEVYELSPNESPQLINIATRGRVGTGNDVMIGGFVIGGTTPKKVLVRVAGPSLAQFGVNGVLADPTLELNTGGRVIAINNDYQVTSDGSPNPDAAAIAASGFQPLDTHECAIIATLVPGSYTAIVRGVEGTQGVAIVEVYDLD